MAYTWAQFTRYLRLARAREAGERAAQLVIVNQALAGGDGAKALLKDLDKAARDV